MRKTRARTSFTSKYCLILLSLLFVSGCAQHSTTVRQAHLFNLQDLKQSDIVVLPTDAVVNTVGAFGAKERMHDYESHMETLLSDTIVAALKQQGYKAGLLSKKEIYEQDISGKILALKERYHPAITALYTPYYQKNEQALAINSNIGSQEFGLSHVMQSKYLVLCGYSADVKTNGSRVAGVLMDALLGSRMSDNADEAVLTIGIVNHQTGEILWSNANREIETTYHSLTKGGASDAELDQKKATRMVKAVLTPLANDETPK